MHRFSTRAALAAGLSVLALAGTALAPASAQSAAAPYEIPAGTPANIAKAVKSPDRTAEMTARDADRKPAETLTLAQVREGDRIVEIASFGQYYTTMLAAAVGPSGHVYMSDLPYTAKFAEEPSKAFVAAHPNTEYQLVDYNEMTFPQNVDAVHIVLYYHDLPLNKIDTAAFNKKVFDALKPGGIYFVVDHNARPGSGTEDTEKLHRIDPDVIRKEITAAGFILETDSGLLAHPADDHTKMVFTPEIRGKTDQSVFVFRKPK